MLIQQLHLIGASFFYMPDEAFGIYQKAIGADVLKSGILKITQEQFQQVTEYFYHRFWGMYSYPWVVHWQFILILCFF